MRYEETLAWLYGLEAKRGMDFRLERLGPVLALLDHPERAFPSIHVAGTNGKGSTAAMLHSIYTHGGFRAGLYTSPHLISFRERVRVGDEMISEERVVETVDAVRSAMDEAGVELTFFEIVTIAAFLEFRALDVDLAVIEVGLGGRLDATNVVRTVAAVITSVALDHERYLGKALADVAFEKVGIVRGNVPVVTGDLPEDALAVVAERVAQTGSRWLAYGKDFGPSNHIRPDGLSRGGLLGEHQTKNAGVALAVVAALDETFSVEPMAIVRGLAATRWPGRLEIIEHEPRIILDAAHNPEAAVALRDTLVDLKGGCPRVLVFGVMADKDWREMLCTLLPVFDHVVLVPVDNPRSLDPRAPHDLATGLRPCDVAASAANGLRLAESIAGRTGTIVVTGSIFLVAELYRLCGGAEDPFANAR